MSAEILFFTGVSKAPQADGPPEGTDLRWTVRIVYRTSLGPMTVEFQVEEIEDVAEAVAKGDDWRCIETITIEICRARAAFAGLVLPRQDNEEDGA